jgi:aminoglycoside phosphotransferase (APT) family kinase protein
MCSEAWYQQVIDTFIFAEQHVATDGETLLHGDVRSDNVCVRGSGVVFVDWAEAMRGNPAYDLAWALPTLHLEGGPRPFDVFPDGGGWAALLSGMHVKRACTDRPAPTWLIAVFKRLVAIELEWAAASLRLPQVDGTNWREI